MKNLMPPESGVLMIISAPLGAGKVTLCQAVLDREPNAQLSVSCTSRSPRAREVDGLDFNFVTQAEFRRQAEAGEFLEWVALGNHLFGTPKKAVLDALRAGRDVILNLDPRGAKSVKTVYPEAVSVFVCPPTWEALIQRMRLHDAAANSAQLIRRLDAAKSDVQAASESDYVLLNDNLVTVAEDLSAILRAERRRAWHARQDLASLLATAFPTI